MTVQGTGRTWIRRAGASVASLVVASAFAEFLLRSAGFAPWTFNEFDAREPTMHEPDPELGWRNRPGSYALPGYSPSASDVHVTIEESGRRRTGTQPTAGAEGALVVVGDSVAMGWAINDDETFAWKLQERFPTLEVSNFGTAGYSTYQAMLLLERALPQIRRPRLVVYDLLEGHETRNAVPDSWLFDLARLSRRGHVDVPRATLRADGTLRRHSPEGYVDLPFRRHSAFVNGLGKLYMAVKTRGRLATRRRLTENILLEMDRISKRSGATLLVVYLGGSRGVGRRYQQFLSRRGVDFVNCAFRSKPGFVVVGEGHPNGRANTIWAKCIATEVASRL